MGWGDESERLIAAVGDETLEDLPTLVDRTLRTVVRDVPSYAEARAPGDIGDFRSGLAVGIRICLECVVDDRPLDDDERQALSLIGAQRARQGVPAADLVTAIGLARGVILDVLLARAGAADVSAAVAIEAARRIAARIARFAEAVEVPLLSGYGQGLEEWFPAGSRRRAVVVDRLLELRVSEAVLAEDARSVGRVLGPRVGLFLVVPFEKVDHHALVRSVEALSDALGDILEGAVRWSPVPHVPMVVPTTDEADWQRRVRASEEIARTHGVGVVVVDPMPTATEVARQYADVAPRLARATASRRGPGVVSLRRLELLHLLAGDATLSDRIALVRRVLGPVLALPDADAMLEILDAFHDTGGRVVDVARAVHRHENTVRKRLDRIEALTGLSMHVPAERYEIDTAVHLHRLLVQELSRLDHRDL